MSIKFKVSHAIPTAEEYVNLRVVAGMSPRDIEGSRIGLKNSNYMVSCRYEDKLIGMGRVVGDGYTTFQITDVVIDPEFQGKGLGKLIMKELIDYLEKNAAPNSYVSLIADGDATYLYQKFGFVQSIPYSTGMHRFIKKQD